MNHGWTLSQLEAHLREYIQREQERGNHEGFLDSGSENLTSERSVVLETDCQ